MLNQKKLKIVVFVCVLLAMIIAAGAFHFLDRQCCMDILVTSEWKPEKYKEVTNLNISQLHFNGERAAVDTQKSTIYISQSSDVLSHYSSLLGNLKSENPNHYLFILKNEALDDIPMAVQSGTPLSLVIVEGQCYQKVDIVITTLPVLNIDGAPSHRNQSGTTVHSGYATLWSGFDPVTKEYSTESSILQWHKRGNTSSGQPKNPWKLSFKNENGENKDLSFQGLGEDDDWVLNSLTMDDTRIKEKLFMDLWNTSIAQEDYNYKMSSGEYVEVVINGEYKGLYLLQRRLDAKYLELSDKDVLLKVTTYGAASVEEAYEFVTPAINAEEIYAIMEGVFAQTDSSAYDLHNIIDTNLMLQMANARDNFSLKNMYHVLKNTGEGYAHFLIPWDTDQSLGVVYKTGVGFCYDYQMALNEFGVRMETHALQYANPEYQVKAAERWKDLRRTALTEERILSCIDELYGQLEISGAFKRDVDVWSNRYGGADTIDQLKHFVHDRLAFLDEYYH